MARLKLDDIRQEVEAIGWKLISIEYKNLDSDLEFRCPEGHKVLTPLKKWRKKNYCPMCDDIHSLSSLSSNIPPKQKGITRVLALDDATEITGWCLFDGKQLVAYGKVKENDSDPIVRISRMKQWLINEINNLKPDYVAIEDIQLQEGPYKNVKMFKTLAHLQGVLLNTLYEYKINYIVVHSATWRSNCGITARTRSDQKRQAQQKIVEWYERQCTQDEADAICIGRYVANVYVKNDTMIEWGGI